jgi:hypothetical protein
VKLHVAFRQFAMLTVHRRIGDPHHRIVRIALSGPRTRRLDFSEQVGEAALIVGVQGLVANDQNVMLEPRGVQRHRGWWINLFPEIHSANFCAHMSAQLNNLDHDCLAVGAGTSPAWFDGQSR